MKYESANLIVALSAYRYYDKHEYVVSNLNLDICVQNFCCGAVSDDFGFEDKSSNFWWK